MKEIIIAIMNWWARPFQSVNAVVMTIFAGLLFVGGVAILWHPYITELLDPLDAPYLRIALRIGGFIFFSIYCTLGCLCRILIHFFPDDLSNEQRR